ncbi:hypothetical protein [Streptosporangium lutulentum]|uniref:hypothetical protein n=1 Tax=Streptosporangium lutulentum TaxID=1461250 RepID=UPI00362FEB3D
MNIIESIQHVVFGVWAVVLLGLVGYVTTGTVRFAVAPVAAKRHYPLMLWTRLRWHWLARNLNLCQVDKHGPSKSRAAFGPTIGKNVRIEKSKAKIRFPRVRWRADQYGIIARVRLIPGVGRKEFEAATAYLADYWKCSRVQVSSPRPGILVVRGLRRDPLADGLTLADIRRHDVALALFLGRDEWATDRWLPLSGIAGITVGGLPGYGKTSLILSWLMELFPLAFVQIVVIDGKGGGDYIGLKSRLMRLVDDDLFAALVVFRELRQELRHRQATVVSRLGVTNGWKAGPREDFSLLVVIVDECHTFFDLDGVKGDKTKYDLDGLPTKDGITKTEAVLEIRSIAADLVKKGRSVMMLSLWLTQKQTSDAIPTAIRDNCTVGLSFAVKTVDAAVAALGDAIRQYGAYCPTTLREQPTYIGVCTASISGDGDPFVRVRVPRVDESAADDLAEQTAHYRRDFAQAA